VAEAWGRGERLGLPTFSGESRPLYFFLGDLASPHFIELYCKMLKLGKDNVEDGVK